jgi:hypothetical protein
MTSSGPSESDNLEGAIEGMRRAALVALAWRVGCRRIDCNAIKDLRTMSDAVALDALRRSSLTSRLTSLAWRIWWRRPVRLSTDGSAIPNAIKKTAILAAALLLSLPALAADLPMTPDPTITPGVVLTRDAAAVCQPGYSKTVRHTSGKLKAFIYREYGITQEQRAGGSHFEVDHLISLELGGADVAENLWPQSFDTQPWNARTKDALENRLHALVCAGRLPLEQAQREIATDWIGAYERYVGR